MRPETRHTVLLIEADASLRRLIALGLKYRGMHVIEASSPMNLPPLDTQQPGLVVLDIDGEAGNTASAPLAGIQAHSALATLPIVTLAWECVPQEAQITCLTKPFDARTLQATIEQMLASQKKVATFSSVPEDSTQSALIAPSLLPLITAAGLLLAFIGFMLSITISVVGLLIVMVGLLWWTLGPKTKAQPLAVEIGTAYPTSAR